MKKSRRVEPLKVVFDEEVVYEGVAIASVDKQVPGASHDQATGNCQPPIAKVGAQIPAKRKSKGNRHQTFGEDPETDTATDHQKA